MVIQPALHFPVSLMIDISDHQLHTLQHSGKKINLLSLFKLVVQTFCDTKRPTQTNLTAGWQNKQCCLLV